MRKFFPNVVNFILLVGIDSAPIAGASHIWIICHKIFDFVFKLRKTFMAVGKRSVGFAAGWQLLSASVIQKKPVQKYERFDVPVSWSEADL
jgi:hypothetical protein